MIIHILLYDISNLSCIGICDYLLYYSIYYDHNVPHHIPICSFYSWIPTFIYMFNSFLSFLLFLISIKYSIHILLGLTSGLPPQAKIVEVLRRNCYLKMLPSRSKKNSKQSIEDSHSWCNYLLLGSGYM